MMSFLLRPLEFTKSPLLTDSVLTWLQDILAVDAFRNDNRRPEGFFVTARPRSSVDFEPFFTCEGAFGADS